VQALHFRPTENRAMAIDDQVAGAHGTADITLLEPVVTQISLVWRAWIRDASIFAWHFCARDKLCDVFVWRVFGVVDPCVPSIGRAGQGRKNWGSILIWGKRISGAPQASSLVEKTAGARICRLVCPGVIDRRYRNRNAAPFAVDPRKVGRPNRRINFAFPYCYFGLFSCKKSFP